MGALLSLLMCLSPRAAGAEAPKPVALSGIRKLLAQADKMARQWSPGARLYSALGRAPGNPARYEPEEWEFIYGDPESKDGAFHVVFQDGTMAGRSGIKGGVRAVEQFQDGRLLAKRAEETEWTTNDYLDCRPIVEPFADAAELDKEIRAVPMTPDSLGRFRFVLLRSKNNHCDGLGNVSQFLPEKPIPKKLLMKSLWIVSGPEEIVFFDAKTGVPLLKRLRGPKGP